MNAQPRVRPLRVRRALVRLEAVRDNPPAGLWLLLAAALPPILFAFTHHVHQPGGLYLAAMGVAMLTAGLRGALIVAAEAYALLIAQIFAGHYGAGPVYTQIAGLTVAMAVIVGAVIAIHRARAAARSDAAWYGSLFETRAVGVLVADSERRFVAGNQRLAEILGYERPEDLEGLTGADVTFPGDPDSVAELASRLFTGELERYSTEKRYRRKDGTAVWARVGGAVVPGTDYYFSFLEDISNAKVAEEELHEKTLLLERAARVGGVGTWIWDASSNRTDWSDQARRIYGFDDEAADSCDPGLFWRIVHSDDPEEVER